MKIDVVIPTYNRLWALRKVAGFYLSREEVRRVIVVDDCSTDGTGDWLRMESEREPRLISLRHKVNRGASAARNTGADAAQAPLVFFADDDMVLYPADGLLLMAREMETRLADIAAPVHIFPASLIPATMPPVASSASGPIPLLFRRWTLELHSRKALTKYALPIAFPTLLACGLMMMRRDVLEKVRYDEELGATSYRDETDFQLKALREGFHLIACTRPVLIDLVREQEDGGCHGRTSLAGYEWMACRNNWRILVRHRDTIRNHLGIRAPILYLQSCFVAEHLVNRFIRYYIGIILRSCRIIRRN